MDAFLDLLLDRRPCATVVDVNASELMLGTVEVMTGLVLICATGTDMTRGVTSLEQGEREVGEGGFVMVEGGSGAVVRVGFFGDIDVDFGDEGEGEDDAALLGGEVVEIIVLWCLGVEWRRIGEREEVGEGKQGLIVRVAVDVGMDGVGDMY